MDLIQTKLLRKQCHTHTHRRTHTQRKIKNNIKQFLAIFAGNGCDIFNLLKSKEVGKDKAKLEKNDSLKY